MSPATQRHRWLRDALAGLVAAVVLIANIVSFGALMFSGPLAAGAPVAIWAMLLGAGVSGLWIAWRTSLPPIATAIDSPTGAVLLVLAASSGSAVLSAGGSPPAAVQGALLLFSAATLLSGLLLLGLGLARWGHFLRFVPHFVVAGFLAATGYLMIVGAVRMLHAPPRGLFTAWTTTQGVQLAAAVAALGLLLGLRRWVQSALALPGALLAMTLLAHAALSALGLSGSAHGWYMPSLGTLVPWSPWQALGDAPIAWPMALRYLPELVAVTIVALVSVVSKTAALEVARKTAGDLDVELRAHGIATLAIVPLGGVQACMQLGSSRLMEHAGGATRYSGVACSLVLLAVGLASFDLPALIPLPVAAGLVLYLGWSFLVEALAKSLAQRRWLQLGLALAIATACVRYGYLAGVLGGVVAACLMFAVSYARTGAVRQHLSRAQFAGHVTRSTAESNHLAEHGETIQLYWLAGYLFFGSSEGVFERVQADLAARAPRQVSHVVLDFALVTGCDASAIASLAKLQHHCRKHGVTLVVSAIAPALQGAFASDGVPDPGGPPPFADVASALAWCEERVLERAGHGVRDGANAQADFEHWLQQQLGADVRAADLMAYLERHDSAGPQVLYRQGDPADEIDLVVAGRLVVDIATADGPALRARTITTCAVIGEMGFFRHVARSATVSTEGAATRFTLTRSGYERLRRERPDLAIAFDVFLLRTLADRINVSERMAAALGR